MRDRKPEPAWNGHGRDDEADDRGAVVVALVLAALSGFIVGLLVRGQIAMAVTVAVLVPVLGFVGWWLRDAMRRDRIEDGS